MKIICIFAENLFAFHYHNEVDNEYNRLMELWTDVTYLRNYAAKNNIDNIYGFINEILENAEQIQDLLENISKIQESYSIYFQPLQNSERNKLYYKHWDKY